MRCWVGWLKMADALLPLERSGLTVLFRGGRLPSWHTLVSQWPGNPFAHPASNEHVDLMLEVGGQHGLRGMEPQSISLQCLSTRSSPRKCSC